MARLPVAIESPALDRLQQQQIDKVGATVFENFQANLYQQELNRVKFLLKSYLRTRFFKITQYAAHISADPEQMNRLAHAEQRIAQGPHAVIVGQKEAFAAAHDCVGHGLHLLESQV